MGTGAVGGYFGARLAAAGLNVCFVARGRNLAALRHHGLVVRTPDGDTVLRDIQATDAPGDAGRVDLVLVSVKTYDTEAAARALRPAVGPQTTVLSLQNGIENEAILARTLGLPPLLLAITQIGAELIAPAEVRYYARGSIVFGEPGGETTDRVRVLADVFARTGIPHRVSGRIQVRVWEKLGWNAAFNAVSALTRRTVAGLLEHPETRRLLTETMEEVAAVAAAQGIALDAGRIPAVLDESLQALGSFKTSMLQDLERGRPLEHDALNGAVVRAAERVGVPAPINRTLCTLLGAVSPG